MFFDKGFPMSTTASIAENEKVKIRRPIFPEIQSSFAITDAILKESFLFLHCLVSGSARKFY